MGRYTLSTTMRELFSDPLLISLRKYLIYKPQYGTAASWSSDRLDQIPDLSLQACANGWAAESVVRGLNLLAEQIELDQMHPFFIYDKDPCLDDPMKADVNLIRLMPKGGGQTLCKKKPYIILAGGGAYQWVSTMTESLPTAVHMVERGYTVFLLTYRVNTDKAALKSLDDLGAAIRYISVHKREMGIETDAYAVGGFSAGANLISNFGIPDLGYKKHNLYKPQALFPIYTFIDLKTRSRHNCIEGLLQPMFGEQYDKFIDEYNIIDRINSEFPPCYIVCGKDDMSVPPDNSERLKKLLDLAGVPAVLEEGAHAPHAFGEGKGTDVEGWPDRAIDFLEKLMHL